MGHVFYRAATLCLFIGEFNPFTFKIIIDMYVLAILLTFFSHFHSFSLFLSSFLALFLCGFLVFFSVLLGFLSPEVTLKRSARFRGSLAKVIGIGGRAAVPSRL